MLISSVLTYPLFAGMVHIGSSGGVIALQAGLAILLAFYAGPMTAMGAEFFATGGRAIGLSIGCFAAAAFGNVTSLLLSWGIGVTHDALLPALYLIAMMIAGAIATAFAPERAGQSLQVPVS